MDKNERYLSVKETAQMLNISVNYLAKLRSEKYNKDKNGNRSEFYIPYLQISKAIKYKYSDFQKWIVKHTCARSAHALLFWQDSLLSHLKYQDTFWSVKIIYNYAVSIILSLFKAF